ncbi:MAG: site-specific integrase [Candidatus Didemnitutus sp.]|nr:site-specific integrase [Candidatus Didemnitutus sp.]
MNQTKFEVQRFENRNGTISWRVSGWLHGVRIRKNFPTREEAAAEKLALELKALQVSAGMRPALTSLTDVQLREAEDAFRRVKDKPKSLLFYLDYALTNYRAPEQEKRLIEAVDDYIATRKRDHERQILSKRMLGALSFELGHLKKHFPTGPVSQCTNENLTAYLERGKPCLKTYNNRRGLISTFFKFAYQKGWATGNPVERTPYYRINHRRGSAVTITAEKAAELMEYVETYLEGELVPYFAICLFAGVRPCIRYGEITKLQPGSVRLDTGVIRIEPEVSKVRMPRNVTIQPNLAAWLQAYPLSEFKIVPKDSTNNRRPIFAKFGLTHDVLRHTFISMFVAKFRSMGEAALQAGNSETIIRKHYLDLKSKEEAERFFAILPKHGVIPATPGGPRADAATNSASTTKMPTAA